MTSSFLESAQQFVAKLFDKLAALQDVADQLKEEIERLSTRDDDIRVESSDIIQIFREKDEDLELLEEEIKSIRPSKKLRHDRDRLKDGVERLKVELKSCRISFRKAQLTAKENRKMAERRDREALWASFAVPQRSSGTSSPASFSQQPRRNIRRVNSSELTKEEQELNASNDVTESLRRFHDQMASELSRNEFLRQSHQESTAKLQQLNETYSDLNSMISNGANLLKTLYSSEKSDTWYLQTTVYVLAVTIGWLLFRRILWSPFWLLVWLPLKLTFRATMAVSSAVGLRGKGDENVADLKGLPSHIHMDSDGVPTINVGQGIPKATREAPDPDSMIEKVGRIIDGSKDEAMTPREAGTAQGDNNGNCVPKEAAKNVETEEQLAEKIDYATVPGRATENSLMDDTIVVGDGRVRDEL